MKTLGYLFILLLLAAGIVSFWKAFSNNDKIDIYYGKIIQTNRQLITSVDNSDLYESSLTIIDSTGNNFSFSVKNFSDIHENREFKEGEFVTVIKNSNNTLALLTTKQNLSEKGYLNESKYNARKDNIFNGFMCLIILLLVFGFMKYCK